MSSFKNELLLDILVQFIGINKCLKRFIFYASIDIIDGGGNENG